jgi:quinoprotein glucose dehydrogenase
LGSVITFTLNSTFFSLMRLCFFLLFAGCCSCTNSPAKKYNDWTVYNGGHDAIKYSSLSQIDTNNVAQLQLAWTYHTGDVDTANHSQIQCNPIIVNGILYGVSPQMKLFAVDAVTGQEKWVFDPNAKTEHDDDRTTFHIMINCRGVAYWSDGKDDQRIFFTAGSLTYAIQAETGKPVLTFGKAGAIDLHDGLGRDVSKLFVVNTSPGVVFNDLLILGTRVDEAPPSAPGHIRAYDVRTGEQRWIFHTIPQPGEFGYETWENKDNWQHIGGANAWSGFSLDEQRGIVFAATGSAAYDFYGGKRKGANLFANCLLAIDAKTGKRIWHFQFIHHDLWDKDLPTPPSLVTLNVDGKKIEAVAQTTKNGMVYVFERATGKPVFDIQEIPVETTSDLAGEQVWPTQPVPVKPAPFVRQTLTAADINPYMPEASRVKIQKDMEGYRFGNMFLPPGTKPSLVLPGYDGGAEWGGSAFDPQTGLLYVNANEMAWIMEMKPQKMEIPVSETNLQAGQRLFGQQCAACHGANRKGTGNNPTLIDIQKKYDVAAFNSLLNTGRRMMPAFNHLSHADKNAVAAYVMDIKAEQVKKYIGGNQEDTVNFMPYKMAGYNKFLTPEGYPAISPPWGTLNAINLNTGELAWKIPLGEYEELKAKGIPATGTENYGGPVVTAGGLVFIAAARDGKFRAFHKTTGKLLWEYQLPAPGFASPAVYELHGKQYIVIACGGGKLKTNSSDAYVVFALP